MIKRGFFIDVQGTLICDAKKEPINGAVEFIEHLNKEKIPYVVITNNTKARSEDFLKQLNDKGFDIKNYIDPFALLKQTVRNKNIAAFGADEFLTVLESMGYVFDYNNPSSLVVSIKKDYTNEDYAQMIECSYKTDELIGMHETSTYAKDGKRYPGVGAIMNMIKFAVNKEYKVVGKPSFNFYNEARKIIDLEFKDITIISDDMMGDLIGAQKLGMKTALVLSGKVKDEKEVLPTLKNDEKPQYICTEMKAVLDSLNRGEL